MATLKKVKGNTVPEVLERQKAQTVAAKAATQSVVSAAPTSTAVAAPVLKPGAMSVDLGPAIAQSIAKFTEADAELQRQKADFNERDYKVSAMITTACVKMTLADPTVDFTVIMGKDKVAKEELNKRVYFGLGLKEMSTRGKAGKEEQVFDWVKSTAVGQLLGDNEKDTPEIKAKKSDYRKNLMHKLAQCQKAALFLIENKNIKATHHEESGTLLLTGPGVQSIYGAPTVLLNQSVKQPLRDAEGNDQGSKVQLKAKPSYTDLARRASEAHGKVIMTRADSRPKQFDDQHAQVVHFCDMFMKILEKYQSPNEAATKALEDLANAIEETLGT